MRDRSGDDDPAGGPPPVRRVAVDGASLPSVVLGDAGGRPVVLLSGLSDGLAPLTERHTRQMFADLPLPMDRFRCLALSHRDPLRSQVTTRELAADAARAIRQVLDEPAVVVCHSMGAMVAQHLAVDAPELVAGMVLSATTARSDRRLRTVLARWEGMLRDGDAAAFSRDALLMSFTGAAREVRLAELMASPPPEPRRELIERHLVLSVACASHDAHDRIRDVRCPTLVLAGELDEVIPVAHARRLAQRLPSAQLQVLPGLGHAFPEQEPDRFEALVTAFLETLPPRPASAPAQRGS